MTNKISSSKLLPGLLALAAAVAAINTMAADAPASAASSSAKARPALTVSLVAPERGDWSQTLAANGSVAAWQEAQIGAELAGLRLAEVLVNVGDAVKRGQLLARLNSDTLNADLAQSRAALAEARAAASLATADADRARQLKDSGSGALSAQQHEQFQGAALSAQARVEAAQARVQADELRLAQTRIVAPDDGLISARTAALGAVAQPGQELFRLIRKGRLEWRAEVPAAELIRLQPGLTVQLQAPGGVITGKLRMLAPAVDPQTRMGIAYVDLPADKGLRAGSFARGEFQLGRSGALSLPTAAVQLRDGFAYVYRVGSDMKAQQTKVQLGRRNGERVEIAGGLLADAKVVASGVGFLSDGDLLKVVAAPAAAKR
ncbi:efflux RND transporter periplasmic adaptor subunit [Pelomonas sp. SE-A7]|uniref:efflux RND transporter periplasmic adaptor subunit n=1 Tax=Pelomonas sp. SE-A7 TaxID=3054953 RepID=UPI00259CD4B2|nr:efflux RND transporter periplasmic adaptor subunit [Pelomonas sp. SE-A7]MDM4767617.1 efflux RND transporter periplasmic adaptor subunit [Pelomonas sp. SE-A7]